MSRVAVIGGGITGLAAALHLLDLGHQRGDVPRVTVFEATGRLGGKIQTERCQGLVIEQGPDSLVAAKDHGVGLVARLGLADRLVGSSPLSQRVYTVHEGRLAPIPGGLVPGARARWGSLLRTPLLSPSGKFRLLLEPLIPPGPRPSETLAGFLRRRLGPQAATRLAEPVFASIYAGRATELGVAEAFPALAEMERRYGSLARALRAGRRPRNRGPGGAGIHLTSPFVTLRDGLGSMVSGLTGTLGQTRILTGTPVTQVAPAAGGRFRVTALDGASAVFDAVLISVPPWAAARLLADHWSAVAHLLSLIPCASTAVVALAYPRGALNRPLDGGGFLVPEHERGLVSGCTWVSAKWPHASPAHRLLVRAFVGGRGQEAPLELADGDLVAAVHHELRDLMGLEGAPVLARVYRWPRAMPQYRPGHRRIVSRVREYLSRWPGLAVAGAALDGVGVPDCIRQGQEAAAALLAALQRPAWFMSP